MHVIAAKAAAFGEALRPEFRTYARQVVDNARALADTLQGRGLDIVSGGTDSHLMLVDLRSLGIGGNAVEASLGRALMTCNKNGIPYDTAPPTITSGIRLGTAAGTTRGFGQDEFRGIGQLIADVISGLVSNPEDNASAEGVARQEALQLTARFPIYGQS
jgi:glycine hydroxymethyltransferase